MATVTFPGGFDSWRPAQKLRWIAEQFEPQGGGLRIADAIREAADQLDFNAQFVGAPPLVR